MDGKKRIARLRNGNGWGKAKPIIFNGIFQRLTKAKPKGEVKVCIIDDFIRSKFTPGSAASYTGGNFGERTDGMWGLINRKKVAPGPFNHHRNFIEKLGKKGFKILGQGYYSTVLAKADSDRVIKVTRTDDGWIDYVKWASERGYAGNLAPMVYSWKKFPAGFSVAVMERMDFDLDNCKARGNDFTLLFGLMSYAKESTLAQVYMEDIHPGAYTYIQKLKTEMKARDIRGANTMVRKDGSLCFTDPVASSDHKTIKTTRLRGREFSSPVYKLIEGIIESCNRYRGRQPHAYINLVNSL